jgi:hypothetical protein
MGFGGSLLPFFLLALNLVYLSPFMKTVGNLGALGSVVLRGQ